MDEPIPSVESPRLYRLCLVIGHRYDPAEMEYTDHYHCTRCGYLGHYDTGFVCWLRETRWRLYWRWRGLRRWITCIDCGCHFGRHDYSENDHLPF